MDLNFLPSKRGFKIQFSKFNASMTLDLLPVSTTCSCCLTWPIPCSWCCCCFCCFWIPFIFIVQHCVILQHFPKIAPFSPKRGVEFSFFPVINIQPNTAKFHLIWRSLSLNWKITLDESALDGMAVDASRRANSFTVAGPATSWTEGSCTAAKLMTGKYSSYHVGKQSSEWKICASLHPVEIGSCPFCAECRMFYGLFTPENSWCWWREEA